MDNFTSEILERVKDKIKLAKYSNNKDEDWKDHYNEAYEHALRIIAEESVICVRS